MAIELVSKILAVGVIVSQVFIVLVALYFLFFQKKYPIVRHFLGKNGLRLSLLISLIATLSSLFYSVVAGFVPCDLCWFQRIFMYPEVILLLVALLKRETKITDYALALAVVGWLISVYHNYIYYQSLSSTFCRIGESCTVPYVTEFQYISIPMMALTAFSLLIIFLLYQKT